MSVLTVEQIERMNELYEQAVSRYLDKTDFNVGDWLSEDESGEYFDLVEAEQEGEN